MIFDVPSPCRYNVYRYRPGPFCIVFYEENNEENRKFYFYLVEILKKFPELPFLRFDFKSFKSYFPIENVTSSTQILIIDRDTKSRIQETNDFSKIPDLLKKFRKSILEKKKLNNVEFKNRNKLKAWAPNCHNIKITKIFELCQKDTASLYDFPNITAQLPKPKQRTKKKAGILESCSKPISEINGSSNSIGKQNSNTISQKINITKPKPIQRNFKTKKESPILKFPSTQIPEIESLISTQTNNNDQPLDLSIRKHQKAINNKSQEVNQNLMPPKIINHPHFQDVKIVKRKCFNPSKLIKTGNCMFSSNNTKEIGMNKKLKAKNNICESSERKIRCEK